MSTLPRLAAVVPLLALALSSLPAPARAGQAPPVSTPSADAARAPLVTVGVAVGTAYGESGGAATVSVQFPLMRFVSLEGDATVLLPGRFRMTTVMSGVSVLFRAGTSRVVGFAGGGVGFQRTTGGFAPGPRQGAVAHVTGDVDLPLTRRLIAVLAVRGGLAPEEGLRIFGGARVPLGARTPSVAAPRPVADRVSAALGKEVRVTSKDGSTATGRLVALTDSTVVVRRNGAESSAPLAGVRKVEKVSHGLRNGALAGAIASAVPWISIAMTRDTCADCEDGPRMAQAMTLVFVGAGMGVGALANAARAGGNLVYRAPSGSRSVSVAPWVAPRSGGVRGAIRW